MKNSITFHICASSEVMMKPLAWGANLFRLPSSGRTPSSVQGTPYASCILPRLADTGRRAISAGLDRLPGKAAFRSFLGLFPMPTALSVLLDGSQDQYEQRKEASDESDDEPADFIHR